MSIYISKGKGGECRAKNPATCRYHMRGVNGFFTGRATGAAVSGQDAFKRLPVDLDFKTGVQRRCDVLGYSYEEVGCA